MPITKGYKQLVAEAGAKIVTRSVAEAQAMLGTENTVFVNLRDPRERFRSPAA
jgi:hypothetical protein